jgi:hypothetical protein
MVNLRRETCTCFDEAKTILSLSLTPRVECLQRINLAVPSYYPPALALLILFPHLRYVQTHEANILRLLSTWKQIVWDVLEMWLYSRRMVQSLIMAEMCECFGVLFKVSRELLRLGQLHVNFLDSSLANSDPGHRLQRICESVSERF